MWNKTISIFLITFLVFTSSVLAQEEVPRDITDETVKNGGGSDLRSLIEEKTSELQKIHDERAKLEQEVAETKAEQRSLNRDIGSINYNIRQLDLSIKSNEIVLDKLELEIDQLQRDLIKTRDHVDVQKEALGKLFFELYQRDQEDFLIVFLRSSSLSQGVSEVQSILTFNNDLTVQISELRDFQEELVLQSASVRGKQSQRESERVNLNYRQGIASDQKTTKQQLLNQTKEEERQYQAKIAELDAEQAEISKVIDGIEEELRRTFDPTLLPVKRSGVLRYPVDRVVVTQKYGKTAFAAQAYRTGTHSGLDFGVGLGTPVYAALDGVVAAADNNDQGSLRWQKYQYGKYVVVDHPNSLSTLYAHLSRFVVSAGEEVKRGDLIGYSGNSGYSTGAHLHFGVYWTPSVQYKTVPPARGRVPVGITIDPEDYL